MFLCVERALVCGILCCILPHVERSLVLRNVVLYFSECGTYSCIVDFCVIFVCVWNALWYCGILCYIYLCVELALVLWNFVLFFSACGTRSGIVEFLVIFICMCNALWYCRFFVLYFSIYSDTWLRNSTSLCTGVLYFVVVFIVVFFMLC